MLGKNEIIYASTMAMVELLRLWAEINCEHFNIFSGVGEVGDLGVQCAAVRHVSSKEKFDTLAENASQIVLQRARLVEFVATYVGLEFFGGIEVLG